MRLTVGPLPHAVYWRRRAIVLGAVLVLLFLVAQACMSAAASPEQDRTAGDPSALPISPAAAAPSAATPSGNPPAAGRPATPDPSGSPATPAGTGSSAPVDPDTCTDQELQITAEAVQDSFSVGTSVRFTIRIRNAGDRSCRRDIGGDQRELYLRQGTGATKVWSTRDCDPPIGDDVRKLAPGFETSHFIVWQGRSSESCDGARPDGSRVEPGEYELTARLGTAHSEPLPITVTG